MSFNITLSVMNGRYRYCTVYTGTVSYNVQCIMYNVQLYIQNWKQKTSEPGSNSVFSDFLQSDHRKKVIFLLFVLWHFNFLGPEFDKQMYCKMFDFFRLIRLCSRFVFDFQGSNYKIFEKCQYNKIHIKILNLKVLFLWNIRSIIVK